MMQRLEASHERCRLNGISPENTFSTKILKGKELQNKLDINNDLIKAAAPFINHLYNFVKGSNFFAILNDSEGCILEVVGDSEIMSEAAANKMIPGAYMDEVHIGTNAMSLVLSEKTPIQISGKEHYIKAYHKWTCSAAPIRDGNGNIIGIIDLTGYCDSVHLHTLGMVIAAANAIENMLKVSKYNTALEISKKSIETIFNSISSGILSADIDGNVTTINKHILKMFCCSEYEIRKVKIWDIIKGWKDIFDRIDAGENIIDEDVYVDVKANKTQFTMTAYPVYSSEKKLREIVYTFYELKKGRKLVGKILSGQAVYTFDKIIGRDKNFIKTVEYAKKIADSKSTVLITGESGTGKEVFAQSIHNYSIRCKEPFIAVNCGAIPRTLIESELFGYEEGSFTGARKGGNAGKFELADGGTIFLDEIGEMPVDMQTRLIRVIEEGVINRIGSSKSIPVDVRIIAATNKDLDEEVVRGNFRKDLFYRLNVLPIKLPSLRDRYEDIPLLVEYYMEKTSKRLNKRRVNISEEYMNYLKSYSWPGNIRELENIIELIVNTETIQMNFGNHGAHEIENSNKDDWNLSLELVEKQHIINVLKNTEGNISIAAKILGIGRNTLYRKLEYYKICCSELEHCSGTEQL